MLIFPQNDVKHAAEPRNSGALELRSLEAPELRSPRTPEPLTVDPHQLGNLPPGVAPHVEVPVGGRTAVVEAGEAGDGGDQPVFHLRTAGRRTTDNNYEHTSASGAKQRRDWLRLWVTSAEDARVPLLLERDANVSSLGLCWVPSPLDLLPLPLKRCSHSDSSHLGWSSTSPTPPMPLFSPDLVCVYVLTLLPPLLCCIFIILKSNCFLSLFPSLSSSFSQTFFYSTTSPPLSFVPGLPNPGKPKWGRDEVRVRVHV